MFPSCRKATRLNIWHSIFSDLRYSEYPRRQSHRISREALVIFFYLTCSPNRVKLEFISRFCRNCRLNVRSIDFSFLPRAFLLDLDRYPVMTTAWYRKVLGGVWGETGGYSWAKNRSRESPCRSGTCERKYRGRRDAETREAVIWRSDGISPTWIAHRHPHGRSSPRALHVLLSVSPLSVADPANAEPRGEKLMHDESRLKF